MCVVCVIRTSIVTDRSRSTVNVIVFYIGAILSLLRNITILSDFFNDYERLRLSRLMSHPFHSDITIMITVSR